MTLAEAMRWAQVGAAVFVTAASWRSPRHRPLAALLVWGVLSDLAMRDHLAPALAAAQAAVRARGGAPLLEPLTGAGRAAGHIHQALWLSWPAGIAAVSLAAFAPRRAWLAALPWAAAMTLLVLGYRYGVRAHAVRGVYLAAYLGSIALAMGAFVGWTTQRRSPRLHHLAALCMVALMLAQTRALFASPWASWDLARVALLMFCSVLVLAYGGWLWSYKSKSASGS